MKKTANGYLLIKLDTPEQMTAGGIVLPDTAKEKPISGIIVVNEDGPTDQSERVVFPSYSGVEWPNNHKLVNKKEILGWN